MEQENAIIYTELVRDAQTQINEHCLYVFITAFRYHGTMSWFQLNIVCKLFGILNLIVSIPGHSVLTLSVHHLTCARAINSKTFKNLLLQNQKAYDFET